MSSFRPASARTLRAGLAALVLLGLGGTACAPQPSPPVPVMVVDFTTNGLYEPSPVELTTIRDITALKGDAANFIGGARIIIDPADPLYGSSGPQTLEQFREIALKQAGGDVRGNFLAHDGVLWPADFHTWSMTTGYWNFERAYNYFVDTGLVDPAEVASPDVFYFPYYVNGYESNAQQFDNALWDVSMSSFVILPFQSLQALPMVMNRGAVAHEFAHLVMTAKGGPELFAALLRWRNSASLGSMISGYKILKSLDEGFADYHAVQSLCQDGADPLCGDTRFIAPTLGDNVANDRDMDLDSQCLTQELKDALDGSSLQDFQSQGLWYRVGSAVAASLWIPGKVSGKHSTLVNALLQSYSDSNSNPDLLGLRQILGRKLDANATTFTLGEALTPLVAHIADQELRNDVCGQLLERLRLQDSDLPICGNPARPGVCP